MAGLSIQTKQGVQTLGNGGVASDIRGDKTGALVATDAHARYQEAVLSGNVFSLTLNATTTGVAAGNIVAAAAAASTNFALFNPTNNTKNYVLWKFGMGIISGTPGGGSLFHGFITGVPTAASVGTVNNNFLGAAASEAKVFASAAGATLTGGNAPAVHSTSAFTTTATAQASPGVVNGIEVLDGSIIIPPGFGWLPLWSAAGTAPLISYMITWEAVPI